MNTKANAQLLVEHISLLNNFNIEGKSYNGYDHMGAILTDTILQAGLNYRTVVAPRVKRVMELYPIAYTTSTFLSIIEQDGANQVLNWQHPEKPRRLYEFTQFLFTLSIESDKDLYNWLMIQGNDQSLLKLRGIGPKTIDYLKNLVNLPAVAVDRHIRTFVLNAGITSGRYSEIQAIVEQAADLLNIGRSSLDHAIWLYMSNKN